MNFTEKLEEDDCWSMFLLSEKQQKTILNFSLDSLIVTEKYNNETSEKILNSMNEANDSKFTTRKSKIVNDQSNANYVVEKETIYNTEVLKSNLCEYNDIYILVRGDLAFTAAP